MKVLAIIHSRENLAGRKKLETGMVLRRKVTTFHDSLCHLVGTTAILTWQVRTRFSANLPKRGADLFSRPQPRNPRVSVAPARRTFGQISNLPATDSTLVPKRRLALVR